MTQNDQNKPKKSKKPIVRQDRIFDENGKYYYALCKCGREKEFYKSSYCSECNKKYQKIWRGTDKKRDEKVSNLDLGVKIKTKKLENRELKERMEMEVVKFVNRINRRGGICSLEDIFVDMIEYYQFFGNNNMLDAKPVNVQLKLMWKFLQNKKKEIEKMTFLV